MGIEALLAPFLGKIILFGGIAVVAILAFLGFQAKQRKIGATEQAQKDTAAAVAVQQEVQAKVDDARDQDQAIDQKAQQEKQKIMKGIQVPQIPTPPSSTGAPSSPGPKEMDKFQFAWLLPLLLPFMLLAGCATTQTAIIPIPQVRVEIPSAPVLQPCPSVPHPSGVVEEKSSGLFVALPMADAQAIQAYLRDAPACYQIREVDLQAYIEKLVNRLRALGGQ